MTRYSTALACVGTVMLWASFASAAERIATDDASVIAAIEASKPGDVIVLAPGRYAGQWRLKPGDAHHPIILRAQRPGTAFVGNVGFVSGWEVVPGHAYAAGAACPDEPVNLMQLSNGKMLRRMSSLIDVEEIIGSYWWDEPNHRVYVHPWRSIDPRTTQFIIVNNDAIGIECASYTVVKGLAVCGFGGAGIQARGVENVIIRDCKLWLNGYGVVVGASKHVRVLACEAWRNCPAYQEGAQIHFSGDITDCVAEGNLVHDSLGGRMGLRFYAGATHGGRMDRNIVVDNKGGGMFFKTGGDTDKMSGSHNVALRNDGDFQVPISRHNTFGVRIAHYKHIMPDPETDLWMEKVREDPRFVDPTYHDYRLQARSPMIGRGAHPQPGEVFFVGPKGNDNADGRSVSGAWKTFYHARSALKPGSTLYILPGPYPESIEFQHLAGTADAPITIRAHGRKLAYIPSVTLRRSSHVVVESLSADSIKVAACNNIVIRRCATRFSAVGFVIHESHHVSLDHVGAMMCGVGVFFGRCKNVSLTSSWSRSTHTAVEMTATSGYFGDFNNLTGHVAGAINGPFFEKNANHPDPADIRGPLTRIEWTTLDQWQTAVSSDAHSVSIPTKPFNVDAFDFRIPAASPLATAGRYNRPIGPHGTASLGDSTSLAFEQVSVLSVTPTTANIIFHTPLARSNAAIRWGTAPDRLDQVYGHDQAHQSEYEMLHTVSLVGLKSKTTYHFQVGTGEPRVFDEQVYSFTTTETMPEPRQLYVSLDGDDQNDGLSPGTAWRTLRHAAREARAGDTVTIGPGRYHEVLRPLQTGTADAPITFRAKKPLTVFINGDLIRQGGSIILEGRPHAIQLHHKCHVHFEHLTTEQVANHGYGGYRGGWGYGGAVRIVGGAGNALRGCVIDCRYRWAIAFVLFRAGAVAGEIDANTPTLTVEDCVTLAGWRAWAGYAVDRPVIFRHNIFYRSMTSMSSIYRNTGAPWVFRNNVFHDLLRQKDGNPWFKTYFPTIDSDYNAIVWNKDNQQRLFGRYENERLSLDQWREKTGLEQHSIEVDPGYSGTVELDIDKRAKPRFPKDKPIEVSHFMLPAESPCRGAGEGGADIGIRWNNDPGITK